MHSWPPLDWDACSVLVLFQVTDLVWVPSVCVCIITCMYELYKVSELFFVAEKFMEKSRTEQRGRGGRVWWTGESERQCMVWTSTLGVFINMTVIFIYDYWLGVCGQDALC